METMKPDFTEMVRKEILSLLEETFDQHHGAYTDKNSSFFETLEKIDCILASKTGDAVKETIAVHVYHTKFYIVVLREYITDIRTGKTDWEQSWTVQSVDTAEWEELKESLKAEYRSLIEFIKTIDKWDEGDCFGGVLAILMHCAYHLGAVRQLMAVRERER